MGKTSPLEPCPGCNLMVDFTKTGKCPHCGSFFGWPVGYGPRAEEEWMESVAANERLARREDGCLGPLVLLVALPLSIALTAVAIKVV